MRKPRMTVPTFLMAFLMAALVAFSCLMCLVDAFALAVHPATLLAGCCAAAVLGTGAMWFRRAGLITAAAGALLLAAILWFRGPLLESLQGFLYPITSKFAQCYASFPVHGLEDANPTLFLLCLTFPLAWLTAWTVSREGSALLVLLACLPVLVLCLIIVDIAPVFWLILLTGALLLLLLSQSVRERNPAEGSRLAWWLVLPTVILVAGITVLWPPAAYERTDWSATLQALAEAKVSLQIFETEYLPSIPKWSSSLQEVDLSQIGPRVTTGKEVLQYRSSSMILYLRGVSLGVYENNAWSAVPQQDFISQTFVQNPLTPARSAADLLELQANDREPLLYTTYNLAEVPEDGAAVDDAYISNTDRQYFYQMAYSGERLKSNPDLADYDAYVQAHYTQVPEELLPELLSIAQQAGLSSASTPQEIASYVRSSGTYDRDTARVPDGEDFVLYFLQQSHRGYCVHFASAAAMLLRALDIPARYVTGYAVSGPSGTWNTVTDESAHAWVEYYVAGTGWQPLDPTPAVDSTAPSPDGETVPPDSSPTQTPEETDPAEPQTPSTTPGDDENPGGSTEGQPSAAQPDTVPAHQTGTSATPSAVRISISRKWLWLLSLPALAALTLLRHWAILRRRKARCSQGHPNRQALTLWHWLVRLSKTGGDPLSEALLCLAEKARFSQHTLTEEELSQLREALHARIQTLQALPPAKRLWYRYGRLLF